MGRLTLQQRLGIVLFLVSMISVGVSTWAMIRFQTHQHCNLNWQQAYAEFTLQARQAAAQDRAAIDKMVTDVVHATTREQSRQALNTYLQTRAEADRVRTENKAPELPKEACQ